MASLIGKWHFVRNENMDKIFDALEINQEFKSKLSRWKPTLIISQNADKWTIQHKGQELPDMETTFVLGEVVEYPSPSGVLMKSTMTLEGDRLIEHQTGEHTDVTLTREVIDNELRVTVRSKGIVATTHFKRD